MAVFEHDQETVRRYLLGQLAEGEEQELEKRLLGDDDFAEELEVTTDELVQAYLAKELTRDESTWFEQHYLASPDGRRSYRFASALEKYISRNPVKTPDQTLSERIAAFWHSQAWFLRSAAAAAVVVVIVGIFWVMRPPPSVANLTLSPSAITRSAGGDLTKIRFNEDVLRVRLLLPASASSSDRYSAELKNSNERSTTLQMVASDSQSVTFEIPRSLIPPGLHAIAVSAIRPDNSTERIPGTFQFIVE